MPDYTITFFSTLRQEDDGLVHVRVEVELPVHPSYLTDAASGQARQGCRPRRHRQIDGEVRAAGGWTRSPSLGPTFRSEVASLGIHSPSRAARPSTAARAVSSLVCP